MYTWLKKHILYKKGANVSRIIRVDTVNIVLKDGSKYLNKDFANLPWWVQTAYYKKTQD